MTNLKYLIDFLPALFKDTDTYKDKDGKGILEKFLEISGEYLEEVITPEIENAVNLIDLEKTPSLYLNYLWEFLGELPFAYSSLIDTDKWELYKDNIQSSEDLKRLSSQWEIKKTGPIVIPEEKIRDLLKYSITLLKIRGTKKFFEVIFKLYGMKCEITDPTDSTSDLWLKTESKFDSYLKYDNPEVKFDHLYTCSPCSKVDINISTLIGFKDKANQYFRDSVSIILSGKLDGVIDTNKGVIDYNSISFEGNQKAYEEKNIGLILNDQLPASYNDFKMFRQMVEKFFDRYLPFNVIPHITYQGIEVNDHVKITANYVDETQKDIDIPINYKVGVKVDITSNWPNSDTRFRVSKQQGESWSKPGPLHSSDEVYYIYVEGTYRFISEADPSQYVDLDVTEVINNRSYEIQAIDQSTSQPIAPSLLNFELTPEKTSVEVKLKSTSNYRGKTTDCRVRIRNTGDLTNSEGLAVIDKPGDYIAEIAEFPVKYLKIKVTREPVKYTVTCTPDKGNIDRYGDTLYTETTLSVSDNYKTDGLTITCINTGIVYPNNHKLKIYSPGTYKFKCTQDNSDNPTIATFEAGSILEPRYTITVNPKRSRRFRNQDVDSQTLVKCYSTNGYGTDFRVKCMETGEILQGAGNGSYFKAKEPKIYHFESMDETTKVKAKAQWELLPYYVTHGDGLYIRPIDATDPNWKTDWEKDKETNQAAYSLASGSVCRVQFLLYLSGKLITDPTYKVVLSSNSTLEYPLNTLLEFNQPGDYSFYVNSLSHLKARLIVKNMSDNLTIKCDPDGVTLNSPTDIAKTTITCTNIGGVSNTDIRLRGSKITHQSPYEFSTSQTGFHTFECVADPTITCTFSVVLKFKPIGPVGPGGGGGLDPNPDPIKPQGPGGITS